MITLAVLAERFAVITGDDHKGVFQELLAVERIEQATNLRVGVRDLADVQVAAVARRKGLGRLIRPVRIVQVRPQEEWGIADLVDPPDGLAHDLVGGSLSRRGAFGMLTHATITIEALVEAAVGMQHI